MTNVNLDTKISMASIKEGLRSKEAVNDWSYDPAYTTYMADRLPGEASPREFFDIGNKVIREMSSGESSDPSKPVPLRLVAQARISGSMLITDFGIGLSQKYCPPDFAKGVRELHRQTYLE